MRSLDGLIRLARFKVEELQKQMATLDEARLSLERQIDTLEKSVPGEQVAATASREGFVAYGSYAQAVIQRKTNLRTSLDGVSGQAEHLREQLEAAFGELKKYELMEERRRAEKAAARAKRAQADLDDVAAMRRAAG